VNRWLVIIFNILGVVKRNPLFLHEIEWKNNGFLFTTPNIFQYGIWKVLKIRELSEKFFEQTLCYISLYILIFVDSKVCKWRKSISYEMCKRFSSCYRYISKYLPCPNHVIIFYLRSLRKGQKMPLDYRFCESVTKIN